MACPLPKSAGSPPLTRFQNRACTFPFTRLLSCAVLVRSTFDRLIFGGLDVMTVSMKKLQISGFALSPTRGGNDVVAFHHVLSMFEVQSTPGAAAALPLEQGRPGTWYFRMSPESGGPVDPIPIIRATRARDFRMPTDRSIAMSPEFDPIGGFERPLTLAWVPVFLTDPPRRFVRMTAMCPVPQVRIEPGIHADEGPFGRYRRIVVAPPPDDGVEAVDEPLLGGCSSVPDFLMHLMEVFMLGGFRRLDAGGETQGDALAGFPRFGLANRVLPDVESQEIEPCDVFNRVERMPDPRFTGLQRSPHLLQPACRDVLRLRDGVIVAV